MNISASKTNSGLLIVACLITAVVVLGQQGRSPDTRALEATSNRYQIIQDTKTTLKLDTVTGATWHLQFASDEDKKLGIYYVWTAIPTFSLPATK